jgi:hypothetical protein
MKKLLSVTVALGLCAAALTGAPKTAQAHTDFFVSLGFAPPLPVIYAPPRVIYAPQPVRYYYPAYPVEYGWWNHHHDWDRDHDRDHRYDRDRDRDYHHDWR